MASVNTATRHTLRTHEGAPAKHVKLEAMLRRSVMSCLLWESEFYEDGQSIAERIGELVPQVDAATVADIAVRARSEMHLRHVPLLLFREMCRHASHRPHVHRLSEAIQRADELTEFIAIYGQDRKDRSPLRLCHQARKALATAFAKFSGYDLAKYNRESKAVTLRDVLRLARPKPQNDEQRAVRQKLLEGTLESPDTWEVALSSGADKRETWTRLLREQKLGGLALLRNLRNMTDAGVEDELIRKSLREHTFSRVLPFRFIAAARFAPRFEPELEAGMFRVTAGMPRLGGLTVILVDVSGSMGAPLSAKSDMRRVDAACGVAMIGREICETARVVTFSESNVEVPPRSGFALRDSIVQSQPMGGTYLGSAVCGALAMNPDRLIVISDEQSHDPVPDPTCESAYMLNVASARNGVGYGPWTHVDGFSEAVWRYIATLEG